MQLELELKQLNDLTIDMCKEVLVNIVLSLSTFKTKNYVEIDDDKINEFERKIEEMCLDILVKERVYASDLKLVTGILKLVSDLERIADHAVDIMTFGKKLIKMNFSIDEKILGMINLSEKMTIDAINSFINKDIKLANEVIVTDDTVDKIYKEVLKEIILHDTHEPTYVTIAMYKTLVVKYIERISDHAVNIAEWVVYISTGFYKDKQIY